LWVILALLNPDPDSGADPLTRLNPDPQPCRKHKENDRPVPDFLEEDVDSVIEDIVMSKDRGLVAELEQKMSSVRLPAEARTGHGRLDAWESDGGGELLFAVETVTFTQLQEYCRSSLDFSSLESGEEVETAEARLESVLDDILQSVEGVSLVETVDCY
jgi:hypothetical protein